MIDRGFNRIEGGYYVCDHCTTRARVTASRFAPETLMHSCDGQKAGAPQLAKTGTILKRRFARLGFFRGGGCGCAQIEADMNNRGWRWCEQNTDRLVRRIFRSARNRYFWLRSLPSAAVKTRIEKHLTAAIASAKRIESANHSSAEGGSATDSRIPTE